ncbi:GNAT family N-acetyltransferase [Paenirhodobacter sp.]|uniref:GNAT family N-acetyltransferase n=1 Tax=Paenirhodobacter sp. TaxID=1965326 RepID=UPI003B3DB2FF
MQIRDEHPADVAPIRALTQAAFATAPHASGTESRITDALRAAGALTLSLVVQDNGALIGHAAFSPVSIAGARGWYGLGPISVDPDHQRRGIGSALLRAGLARLRAMGANGCVVLGDPAWYGRFGFAADPALWLADVPPEYFQSVAFRGTAAGEVRYHPAFAA